MRRRLTMRRRLLLAAVILGLVPVTASGPMAAPYAKPDVRRAVLDAARAPVEKELNQPVRFVVEQLGQAAGWAFLRARMVTPDGRPISYAGTRFAEAAANGGKSTSYAALLRRDSGTWNVTTYAIGPTDLAWHDWQTRYRAPKAIFEAPETEGLTAE
ncbi:MAG: hypothetical protein IKE60_21745 [Reyranella sp.]|jgi:hypothetical protein|uniref:hypothetical protein n=1 Tax=Reyranella sp. TaxID=1929291 RepID=UPI000967E56C|nr:hypothetical protein [Reyranella sp.]MBN9538127.1 hypothetical protein [Alphaproteobacteria bacterium]MBR2817297.1 hypothetical protein [Reyranella sp.]OJU31524.1 MAG: hypothetical protein BGN99_33300 [Alphaproteobacteria bacterium 65-37]